MSYIVGQGSDITSSHNITVSVFEDIKTKFYEVKYGEFHWSKMILPASVDTSINVGARSSSYPITDNTGMGAFVNAAGTNIPTVNYGVSKSTVPIEMAAVSGIVTLDEARQVSMGFSGVNMITKIGGIMRKAAERHIERSFFFGNADLGFDGFVNNPSITLASASTKAAGGTTWDVATADEIIDEVNNSISLISENTRQIAQANHVILPTRQFNRMATLRIGDTNISVLEYLRKNNVYTANTGQELIISSIPYTNDIAVANPPVAAGTGRMIVKVQSEENDWLPMPETPNMLAPQPMDLSTKLYATYTLGPYHNRYPAEMIYVDGI
jgi:hypothetical protein